MKLFNVFLFNLIINFCCANKTLKFHNEIRFCSDKGFQHGELSSNCHELPTEILDEISENFIHLCSKSYQISCISAHEKFLCKKGIKVAESTGKCDENPSYSFRKCCNACKFGMEMKSSLGQCTNTFLDLSDVIEKCCNSAHEKTPESPINDEISNVKIHSNLCSQYSSLCHDETEICVDGDNIFRCECKKGFEKLKSTDKCVDIDECYTETHNCTSSEVCKNEIGSFRCEKSYCPVGLKSKKYNDIDGFECVDINECDNSPCGNNLICENNFGSYKCLKMDILSTHSTENSFATVNETSKVVHKCGEGFCDNGICTILKKGLRCEIIECGDGYTKFLKTNCRRKSCNKLNSLCKSRPLRISHFFKTIDDRNDNNNKKLFRIDAPSTKIYKNFKLQTDNNEFFKIKEASKGAVLELKFVPNEDQNIQIEFEVFDSKGHYKGNYLYIYHVYVNN